MISAERTGEPGGDYLPARMLNEVTYCPRLFYYEHVEGVFAHNQFTVEGAIRHAAVDSRTDDLPPPEELAGEGQVGRARSVTLSSERYGILAKMDLVELDGRRVTPVDYKRGRPRQGDEGELEAWEPDQIQLGAQSLILREHGYECDEAVAYYATTRQRVRVVVDDDLVRRTLGAIERARAIIAAGTIPPPLVDSPKCPGCSLVGICLPDETQTCAEPAGGRPVQRMLFDVGPARDAALTEQEPVERPVRRLLASRDELRPLYLNTQGLYVGKSGHVLKIKERDKVVQEVRINEICQLNLFGNVQLTTQVIQTLCEAEVPIAYFSLGGWFYGVTQGLGVKNIQLRRDQFRLADVPGFCLRLARALVAGKLRNQRTLVQRNHLDPPRRALDLLKVYQQDAERAESLEQLLGIEGNGARLYFEHFAGMLKAGGQAELDEPIPAAPEAGEVAGGRGASFTFDFRYRNRRPPRDPVNALLSLAYSLLAKDLTAVVQAVGLDPYLGYYHQPRFGRASLALDVMEPFRPLIADSAVLSAINLRMVTPADFVRASEAVSLTPEGRKKFFRAYEQRMDALVTHPLFGYRVSYRRLLEIQTRLLARVLTGEIATYPVFVTR